MNAFTAAASLGVNGQALLAQASWQTRAAALDPSSATYQADLEAAIKAELEASPWIAQTPGTPPRSGGNPPNGPTPPARATSIHGAVAAQLNGQV
jgi:hypothetical protein